MLRDTRSNIRPSGRCRGCVAGISHRGRAHRPLPIVAVGFQVPKGHSHSRFYSPRRDRQDSTKECCRLVGNDGPSMKFAIVGAGAIGGFLGAMLARAGEDVTLIARGPHLRAIQQRGLHVRGAIGDFVSQVAATDNIDSVGSADVVLLTVKAHSLTGIAPRLAPLIGPDTSVISAQNGIPWWYFYRNGGEWEGTQLESVDPGGIISKSIDPARVIGCIVYPSTIIIEPGVIDHIEGIRFSLGEPDGSKSERCRAISAALVKARLKAPVRTRIRHDLWLKLLGNVAMNPLSALTRATLVEIATTPETRAVAYAMMEEAD